MQFIYLSSPKGIFFIDFREVGGRERQTEEGIEREREREGGREGERGQCEGETLIGCLPYVP